MRLKHIVFIFLFLCQFLTTYGQDEIIEKTFVKSSSMNYSLGLGIDIPIGDLANRFGTNLAFKGLVEKQTSSNWVFGLQFDFMFGNTVKEDVVERLRTGNGNILGNNSAYASVIQRQRGAFLGLHAGRIIPISEKYKSGLKITVSGGLFQHNIRVIDDLRSFPQINDEYSKGYDKLTRGLGVKEFFGWQYLSENKRINFYVGLELTQGFTKSVRNYDFDSGMASNQSRRFDGSVGLRVGWILPFYGGYEDEEIFY